jgi:hypothetical protein
MPGIIPRVERTSGSGIPGALFWRIVSSYMITPLMNSATPGVVKSISRYVRRLCAVDSIPDAAFMDRYLAEYEKVKTGEIPLEGGWRVYSSGAGIALRLIHECLIGLRRRKSALFLDPVIPKALDGLRADLDLVGKQVSVVYRSEKLGCGPKAVILKWSARLRYLRDPSSACVHRRPAKVQRTVTDRVGEVASRLQFSPALNHAGRECLGVEEGRDASPELSENLRAIGLRVVLPHPLDVVGGKRRIHLRALACQTSTGESSRP